MIRRVQTEKQPLDPARPFAPAVLRKARALVDEYQVVLWREEGLWYGRGMEYPTAMSDGHTPAACIAATREALLLAVATDIEQGNSPPPPAREGKRTEQVNVRLSIEEKQQLETAARRAGFTGVGDFMRSAAVSAGERRSLSSR